MTQPTSSTCATISDEPASDTRLTCPDAVAFCNGGCRDWDEGNGTTFHGSDFDFVPAVSHDRGESVMSVSVTRADENHIAGEPKVQIITADFGDNLTLTAAEARRLAALLLNSADDADPIPTGVLLIAASAVRIGDLLLTPDGWQQVTGQMTFAGPYQVSIYTEQRDLDSTDGWQYDGLTEAVKVRRTVHGGDVALTRPERPALSAVGWCSRCTADRVITGTRVISVRGVIRVRGRCQTCNKRGQCAFAGLTEWAEDAR
jgi:hypothetical protein